MRSGGREPRLQLTRSVIARAIRLPDPAATARAPSTPARCGSRNRSSGRNAARQTRCGRKMVRIISHVMTWKPTRTPTASTRHRSRRRKHHRREQLEGDKPPLGRAQHLVVVQQRPGQVGALPQDRRPAPCAAPSRRPPTASGCASRPALPWAAPPARPGRRIGRGPPSRRTWR